MGNGEILMSIALRSTKLRHVHFALSLAIACALCAVLVPGPKAGAATTAPDWTQLSPATSPGTRDSASMAYDPGTGNMVLFGGAGPSGPVGDTWTWNGATWTQQSPATSPPGREYASMAYDAATGQMVLFGGFHSNNGSYLNDTWTWDGTTWTQHSPATSPSGRVNASMAYDAATGQMVLFGGQQFNGSFSNNTWTWDGTTWTQQSPATSPSARDSASMSYDAATGQMVLFGGYGSASNDTWTWDGTTWTQQSPATSPAARNGPSMAYDAASGAVVLFGGITSGTVSADTWSWDGTTWTQLAPLNGNSPAARDAAMMDYDTATGFLVLFGGVGNNFVLLNDTWVFEPAGADTVSFSSDVGAAVASVSGPDGSSITLPTDTQGGFIFDGWFTAPTGGTEVGAAGASYVVPAGGTTLYAQWTENPIDTVAFNSDGGAAVASVSGPDGSSITLPTDTQAGFTLDGWFTAPSGGTKVGAAGASYTIPVGGATLFAQWISAPTLATISPQPGPTSGGTAITITGTGFVSGARVVIGQGTGSGAGAIAATNVVVVSSTEITAVTGGGAKAGVWPAYVINPDGGKAEGPYQAGYFFYEDTPKISSVSPTSGPVSGGPVIVIMGSGYGPFAHAVIGQGNGAGAGAIPCGPSSTLPGTTELDCQTPGGAKPGTWNVFVINSDGVASVPNSNSVFTYDPLPHISSVSPTSGPTTGGTPITITGTGFMPGASLVIGQGSGAGSGAIAATNVVVVSSTEITAVTGGGAKAGTWLVYVINPDTGVSPVNLARNFTYQ
jgi:hypothetical protein